MRVAGSGPKGNYGTFGEELDREAMARAKIPTPEKAIQPGALEVKPDKDSKAALPAAPLATLQAAADTGLRLTHRPQAAVQPKSKFVQTVVRSGFNRLVRVPNSTEWANTADFVAEDLRDTMRADPDGATKKSILVWERSVAGQALLLEAFVEAHEELFGEPIAGKEGYLATLAKATQLMASWGSVRTHPT